MRNLPMTARSYQLVAVFCLSMLAILAGLLLKGPYSGSDTPQYLSAASDFIGALSLELPIRMITEHRLFPGYFISSIYLGGVHDYLSLGHPGVIVSNSILFSLIVCVLFSTWHAIVPVSERHLFNAPAVGLIAGGIYIAFGLPDAFLWTYAVLTDIIFLFWIAVFVFAVIKALVEGRRSMWILAVVMGCTAPFVRPPGILLPLLFLFAVCVYWLPFLNRRPLAALILCSAVPLLLTVTVVPWLILESVNNKGSTGSIISSILERQFHQSVFFFQAGKIVATRLEVGTQEILSYGHIVETIAYRLMYYWIPIRLGEYPYSFIHNLVNGVYMIVTLPLLLIGVVRLLKGARKDAMVLLFLVMVALSFSLLHSVTLVSFDWRYQLPAMVPYWILAGRGWCRVQVMMNARRGPGNQPKPPNGRIASPDASEAGVPSAVNIW